MNLDNSYARLPEGFHALVERDAVTAPSMLAWNNDLAVELGLDSLAEDEAELVPAISSGTLCRNSVTGGRPCWARSLLTPVNVTTFNLKALAAEGLSRNQ